MPKEKTDRIPEKQLLALHSAVDGPGLWKSGRQLLHHCFENHFIVAGFGFRGSEPMIIKRGKPAPPRDSEWWARNCSAHPLLPLLVERPDLNIIRITDIISAEEIRVHPYYEEFMIPDGWFYSVGVFIRMEGRIIGMLAVNRREEQGDFSEEEMRLFERLYPHIETAWCRVAKIQSGQAATLTLAAMLARLPLPVAVVSWEGEIRHINDPGRQACLDWDSVGRGETRFKNLSEACLPEVIRQRCLRVACDVDVAATTNSGHLPVDKAIVSHPKNASFRAEIERILPRDEPFSSPAFLVVFETESGGDPDTVSPTLLSHYFSLSTAEKAVAELIFDGKSNKEIASLLGKSVGTVKKQTESIYRKLGIHDRRRLIALAPQLKSADFLESKDPGNA